MIPGPQHGNVVTLWRAAHDTYVRSGTSFAENRVVATLYQDNGPFGGPTLYRIQVRIDPTEVLDLTGISTEKAMRQLCRASGRSHPGAIGPDEWAPRIADDLHGYAWVKVEESYPEDTTTWIWTGSDPLRSEVDDAMLLARIYP